LDEVLKNHCISGPMADVPDRRLTGKAETPGFHAAMFPESILNMISNMCYETGFGQSAGKTSHNAALEVRGGAGALPFPSN
jgi:hypothetical protein